MASPNCELSPHAVAELFGLIRRQTRSSSAHLARIEGDGPVRDARPLYGRAEFEKIGPDLYRAPGWEPSSPPVYLSHSEADRDAAIVRPLAWRDPGDDGQALHDLLFGTAAVPTGGYALARLGERDLVLFLDHLPTLRLDPSELLTSLYSARSAGAQRGVDAPLGNDEPECLLPARVGDSIDRFLVGRPTGWARARREPGALQAWVRESRNPIAAYLDAARGILVMGLRSFLGNIPLGATERLLRMNLSLLSGAIAALRDGAQGELVILQRLCCVDLDDVELERSVSFLERVKIPWARDHRSAVELLGALERNREKPQGRTVQPVPTQPSLARRRPDHLLLGTLASGDPLRIPVSDLLTHLFVCGGSGSGKTIACKHLIEELALAGVPSIVVDLKGDLSSLACVPCSTKVEAITEYLLRLHGDAAPTARDEIAECARRASALYRDSGFDAPSLSQLREGVRYRILTPRSDVGIPISLSPLGRIELDALGESGGIIGNRPLHELVDANLRGLVEHIDLSDADGETLVAVLTQLLEVAYRQGLPLLGIEGIETLVRLLYEVSEHASKINFLPTEWAIEKPQAEHYARAMNARLGGIFRYWFDGEPLSIDDLISPSQDRVPVNILNLSMLPTVADQSFAIAQMSSAIIEWMRRQPGAQRPRLVYFIDEIAQDGAKGAIFPPYPRNPITKPGLTILLKQGRAFGVSCILATQNAKDIDYKGLGQIDTWLVGRLKTSADMERLKLGMEAAQTEATHGFGDQADDLLSRVAGLAPGSFVIKTRANGVMVYKQRWIRSLHERMTPEMVKRWARAEELHIDAEVERAQELWNQGRPADAIASLETVIAVQPYYTRIAEAKLVLCEWLFRSEQWSRAAECASTLRETVRSRSGFELTHYYEGLSNFKLQQFDRAREALERFVASAAGGSSPLGERCRKMLDELFIEQDDYATLEASVEKRNGASRGSKIISFCRAMRAALSTWPGLRGELDGATVIESSGKPTPPEQVRFARKRGRTVQAYVAEIQRRLGDLDLSAPEVSPWSSEEGEELREIARRIDLDEEELQARRTQLAEILAEAERLIAEDDFRGASQAIDDARKLVRTSTLPSEDLERVISLYRGATSAGLSSLREWLLAIDPHRFELEVAALFRSLGYQANATKASGDGGVDVWAEQKNRRFVIQCKRYRHPVAPDAIRELATVIQNFDADEGIFVTTSRFTEGCREEAERHGIQLIDLEDLLRLYGDAARTRRGSSPAERPIRPSKMKLRTSSSAGVKAPPRGWEETILICLDGADEPLMVGEIADRCGLPLDECKALVQTLVAQGRVSKTGSTRGTSYTLE
jgi:tetratricopeptide (TPR) repeat protein